ncbi:MAG: nuclear transport factor 2 family protein [Candidatus Lambdaproteobacteria bacterium]|nr:nuclear transport factor 2 family protein [Candidatus Lambdaproteobacteria bacterium]
MSAKPNPTVRAMQAFLDAFNRHDADAIAECFAEDGVYETPRGPEVCGTRVAGKANVRAHFAKMFAAVPDIHFGADTHWISGDRAVSEWTMTYTKPDGKRLEVRGCDLFAYRGDKIAKKDSYLKERF